MKMLVIVIIVIIGCAQNFGHEVKYAAVLYRHGDRMPVDCYPSDPYKNESLWPAPFGQLTNVGKRQHFMLGKYLRQRYTHLLSNFYNPKEVLVRSTDVDRTLMSAEANLAGLYPPIGKQMWDKELQWQPIPVHTTPEHEDGVLAMKKKCPQYESELAKYRASPKYISQLALYRQLMDYLSNNTGSEVQDFTDVMLIYSCLNIERLYNFTLPAWTKTVFPEPLHRAAGMSFATSAATPRLARLIAGPLVQQITHAMQDVVLGGSTLRLSLYSGHDFTVATLLTALQLFDDVCPEYTATVFLELLKDNSTHDEWYVRVSYRNSVELVEPTVLTVPGCSQLCPLFQFVRIYENLITVDWERECQLGITSQDSYNQFWIVAVLSLTVALSVVLTALVLLWYQRRCGRHYKLCNGDNSLLIQLSTPTEAGKKYPGSPASYSWINAPSCLELNTYPAITTELISSPAVKIEQTPKHIKLEKLTEVTSPFSTPLSVLHSPSIGYVNVY